MKNLRLLDATRLYEHVDWNVTKPHDVVMLSKAGADALNQYEGHGFKSSWSARLRYEVPVHFDHDVWRNRVLANLIGAFRQQGGEVVAIVTDRRLRSKAYQDKTKLENVEPDAILLMRFGTSLRCYFLELDTGTMSVRGSFQNSFDGKIPRYGDYLKHRLPSDHFFDGLTASPQILVVTLQGSRRAHNLRNATAEAGGRTAYWFTTADWIEPNDGYLATDDVWLVPGREQYASLSLS